MNKKFFFPLVFLLVLFFSSFSVSAVECLPDLSNVPCNVSADLTLNSGLNLDFSSFSYSPIINVSDDAIIDFNGAVINFGLNQIYLSKLNGSYVLKNGVLSFDDFPSFTQGIVFMNDFVNFTFDNITLNSLDNFILNNDYITYSEFSFKNIVFNKFIFNTSKVFTIYHFNDSSIKVYDSYFSNKLSLTRSTAEPGSVLKSVEIINNSFGSLVVRYADDVLVNNNTFFYDSSSGFGCSYCNISNNFFDSLSSVFFYPHFDVSNVYFFDNSFSDINSFYINPFINKNKITNFYTDDTINSLNSERFSFNTAGGLISYFFCSGITFNFSLNNGFVSFNDLFDITNNSVSFSFDDVGGSGSCNFDLSYVNGSSIYEDYDFYVDGSQVFNGTDFIVTNYDFVSKDTLYFNYFVNNLNLVPVISSFSPVISSFSPLVSSFNVSVSDSVVFSVSAFDGDNDSLSFDWFVNGSLVSSGSSVFNYSFDSVGSFVVSVVVSDGFSSDSFSWSVVVNPTYVASYGSDDFDDIVVDFFGNLLIAVGSLAFIIGFILVFNFFNKKYHFFRR